jgi:hypothetical protein
LNFLDHRIKCGNSLVGVLDLDCLNAGIPDEAFKAVTGDDKKWSSLLKKRNKKERENLRQLSTSENLDSERSEYIENARMLGEITESTPQEVKQKEEKYQKFRRIPGWWRDYSACNLWTAAFFHSLTEDNLSLLATTQELMEVLRGNLTQNKIIDSANHLAEEKHFFHWCLEFPEVFEVGGFDCVLGNPPWERIKLQEKEFFASRSLEIANAQNKAAREKLIKELPKQNPVLAQAFEDAKHDAEAQSKFIREANRFLLTAVGDINTYSVFTETMRNLISINGRVGVIVPTGIATDDTCKQFFGDLVKQQSLASLYDFENREAIFTTVHRSYKFSLLAISGKPIKRGNFAFFLTQTKQLENETRLFQLSPKDIALINPNTLTCPVFRTSQDAELSKKIYRRIPILINEIMENNNWQISFMTMFHVSNDSTLFRSEENLISSEFQLEGNKYTKDDKFYVPMYEGRMIYIYEHLYATYDNIQGDYLSNSPRKDTVKTQFWTPLLEVNKRLENKDWTHDWFFGIRRIARSTDERTIIGSIIPKTAVTYGLYLLFSPYKGIIFTLIIANFNSIVLDYLCRNKISQPSLTYGLIKQLPVIPPETYTQKDIEFISTRVAELVYTAWDMKPFAQDMGYNGEPFTWNPNRRALLRAELDAYYAKLYGLTRDELRYILDPSDVYGSDFPSETFRVLKNNEIKQFGEYRTQRLVLEAWDRMFGNE